MMSEIISILSEYISIIVCMHTYTKAPKKVNAFNSILCVLNAVILLVMEKYSGINNVIVILMYFTFLLYAKVKLVNKWFDAIKAWILMLVTIPSLQLGLYIIIKTFFKSNINDRFTAIIANITISVFFVFWKEKIFSRIVVWLRRKIWIIVAIAFIAIMLYLFTIYKTERILPANLLFQMVGVIWAAILFLIVALTAEMEKKNKDKELRQYQIYNKSFEDAINTIRQRQHEFTNHINAIKGMEYTIHDTAQLIDERNKYCNSLLKENALNSLLKRELEPIVIGVLYTKLIAAQSEVIDVSQKIHVIDFKKRIAIVELVEIIGILIDNAVEALLSDKQLVKKLRVRILLEADKHFSIEVANSCEVLSQCEIEEFVKSGYSTKGVNRGFGLARLKTVAKKNNAKISMGNMIYEEQNYFSVRVYI